MNFQLPETLINIEVPNDYQGHDTAEIDFVDVCMLYEQGEKTTDDYPTRIDRLASTLSSKYKTKLTSGQTHLLLEHCSRLFTELKKKQPIGSTLPTPST